MAASNRIGNVLAWVLQVLLAALFLLVGSAKFGSHSEIWVQMFAAIGIGQRFRLFTGGLEILCAILLLIPRTAARGAAFLSCTMVAAFFVRLFVLRGPTRDAITRSFTSASSCSFCGFVATASHGAHIADAAPR